MYPQDRDTTVCSQKATISGTTHHYRQPCSQKDANSTHRYRQLWIAGQGLIQRDVGRGEGHSDIAGSEGQQRRPAVRVIGCQDVRIGGPCTYVPHLR